MEIKTDSKNESQLKRITKSPLLLNQEKSLAEKVKKYPCLFDKIQKTYKEGDRITLYWRWYAVYCTVYIIAAYSEKIIIQCFSERIQF